MNINMELKPEVISSVVKSIVGPMFELQTKRLEAHERMVGEVLKLVQFATSEFIRLGDEGAKRSHERYQLEMSSRSRNNDEEINALEREIKILELKEHKRELERRAAKAAEAK